MNLSRPVLLLDLSSYIFYRGFAINSWMVAAGVDPREFGQEEFLMKYRKVFESKLASYLKRLKVPPGNVILAKDCPRDTIWRMDVFSEYKMNRADKTHVKHLDPEIFSFTYNVMLPKLLKSTGMHMVSYRRAEADDVIAIAAKWLRRVGNNTKVYVMSCDTDLLQLRDDYTEILDFNMKSLVKGAISGVMDVYVRWKIIQGDPSDNIPAIDTKIGRVTAEKLARDSEMLEKRLQKPGVREAYERNDVLINLDKIPEDISRGVEADLEGLLKSI